MPGNAVHHPEIAKILETEAITAATRIEAIGVTIGILGVETEILEAQISIIITEIKILETRIEIKIKILIKIYQKDKLEIMR